jgi:hypothetical protein
VQNRPFQPWRHPWITLVLCTSIAAALNVPLAFPFVRPESAPRPNRGKNSSIRGGDAAAAGWPDATPVPWPAPHSRDIHKSFGMSILNVFAAGAIEGESGFQITTELYGWPLPVLRRTQRWWNWDDLTLYPPGATSPALFARPQLLLSWPGLLLNPLIAALPMWGLLVLPGMALRHSRRKRGLCENCGYPRGTSPLCTECGSLVEHRDA